MWEIFFCPACKGIPNIKIHKENLSSKSNDLYKRENKNSFDIIQNQSFKKNYSIKVLLKFLPDLLEEKGINANKIQMEAKNEKVSFPMPRTLISSFYR